MLRADHTELKRLFRDFESTEEGKGPVVTQMLELLTVHTYLENECMYPRIRELVPDLTGDILESYEEHHVADLLCTELAMMSESDERFEAKATVLIESVKHHIAEEEDTWFPAVREALGRKQLQEIGAEMTAMRPKAPTKPSQPSALRKALDAVVR
jgi:hemerythrin-like domain-containing protein